MSSEKIPGLYDPRDLRRSKFRYKKNLGHSGEYPYTRGTHKHGYREQDGGRIWTMRQYSGFGTAEATNARYKYLLGLGQTGISVAYDMPTMHGYDSDNPDWGNETALEGVAVDTLRDTEILFRDIPLGDERRKLSVSMTINSTAAVLLAMHIANAENLGIPAAKLRGTTQNDLLKEFQAQKEQIFPLLPSLRLTTDINEFAVRHMPKWYPISISGYHIREKGATALQELTFTIANGDAYVNLLKARGLDINRIGIQLSFFWDIHNNWLEEIAKLRAARRIWARIMKEWHGAANPEAMKLKAHCQTAGVSLTLREPDNNLIRTTLQALAAVLGGAQSLHVNSRDEVMGLPTEESVLLSLRTHQILAHETKIAEAIDALGGAYCVEHLANQMEEEVFTALKKIKERGGIVRLTESGWVEQEIEKSAYQHQMDVESQKETVVGVNKFVTENAPRKTPLLIVDEETARRVAQAQKDKLTGVILDPRKIEITDKEKLKHPVFRVNADTARAVQIDRLRRTKMERNNDEVVRCLDEIKEAVAGENNLMPPIIDAVKSYTTIQEISDALRSIWGEYTPQ